MATSTFAQNIQKFCDKTKVKPVLVLKKLAFDGLRGVMLKSPVDTGRFRANWRVAIGGPDLTTDTKLKNPKNKGGLKTAQYTFSAGHTKATSTVDAKGFASGSSSIAAAKWGDSIWITNNLPYGPRLEQGWSKQAPNGMLKLTFEELKAGFEATVKSVGAA